MFESIFTNGSIDTAGFFAMLITALLCGFAYALLVCKSSKSSRSFFIAAALLPVSVALVIALVNGSLGVGVAIAGAFGLVRFRSAPGTAREIAVIFIAMAAGLAFGMGFLLYGGIFLIASGVILLLFEVIFVQKGGNLEKIVKITVPESLDYTTLFDDIFAAYTTKYTIERVKTVNMGSMFALTYRIKLKDASCEKQMLDAIRTRNGNLEVMCCRADIYVNETL